ncbi:HNH endonuclease [Paenibacillus sp. FSL W8-0187]|uniref:HNH endonuclease signature motif containing protein n=1 Tax=Paenibacillus sp. FSL W8-0187 TaxID=2921710 RepID=UPI0030DD1DBF
MKGVTVSIDRIVIDFTDVYWDFFNEFHKRICHYYGVRMTVGERGFQYRIRINTGEHFLTISYKLVIAPKTRKNTLRIEVYPKSLVYFCHWLEQIREYADQVLFVRCDVAFEIPVRISDLFISQDLESMKDSDYWLENVIPQKPNYFSKEDQTVTYLSRLNFMTQVTIPQQQAAMLDILFGIVAIVLAIPTGGGSLYLMLIAGAEIGVGIMQIKVNSEKLRDLDEGNSYSNPAVMGMNQDTLNQLEMGLGVVSLAFLFKPNNLKIADKFKDSQRLAAFKEAAGNKYASFKATMNDANIKMNPSNYKLSWEEAYSLSTNAGTMGRGGPGKWRLDRVADEPFIQFSKSGSGGTGNAEKAFLDNINDFVLDKKKFEEVLDDYAKHYVEVINIKNWSWKKNIPGGTKLTATQRALIKQRAEDLALIPKITVIKVPGLKYGFADFEGAGVVIHADELPESLWLKKDDAQFSWLDERLPDNVRELVGNGTYTWYHTETPGKMQLVPYGIHNITLHNGGRTAGLWADAPR